MKDGDTTREWDRMMESVCVCERERKKVNSSSATRWLEIIIQYLVLYVHISRYP